MENTCLIYLEMFSLNISFFFLQDVNPMFYVVKFNEFNIQKVLYNFRGIEDNCLRLATC